MLPLTLTMRPDSDGYQVQYPRTTVNSGPLDGGASVDRADLVGATGQVSLTWTTDKLGFSYLTSFFRTGTTGASDPFYIELLYDTGEIESNLCKLVDGSFGLSSTKGLTFVVKASLEVFPNEVNPDYDNGLVAVYGAYGINSAFLLNHLSYFVNTQLGAI